MPPPDPTLPDSTAEQLRSLYATRIDLPPDLDDRILAHARRSLAHRRRWTLPWNLGLAAAAGLAIGISLWLALPQYRAARPPLATNHPTSPAAQDGGVGEDLNGDGRIDILDALTLARAIQSNSPDLARWDLTRGRAASQRDIDALAMSAVQLRGGAS